VAAISYPAPKEQSDSSDEPLVDSFLSGDSRAFGVLVGRYQARVFKVVRRYAASSEDANDLAQRAFLKALESAPSLRRAGSKAPPFRAWLLRIAVNLAKNHRRWSRLWRRASVEQATALGVAPLAANRLEELERNRRLRDEVLKLPARQREVLTLRVDGELPFAEIAQVLGLTENNAKVHFHHAVKRLTRLLADKDKKDDGHEL
jgi:RNA polymerase sigma-70 factor (ECF subfamily)